MKQLSKPALLLSAAFIVLASFTVAFVAGADEPEPVSAAACQTMDGIFRPMGVRGKQQLMQHLIESSDRLALQSDGELRQAAETHAAYVRLLYAEELRAPGHSGVGEQTHSEGLKAYGTIRNVAGKSCSLTYLRSAAQSVPVALL